MIYNQWYLILESKELSKRKPLKVIRLNEPLALWRDETGNVSCISDQCCHRGASLSCGKIVNGKIKCPFHGFLYEKTGRVSLIPANGKNHPVAENFKVKAYTTYEAYGFIWIWWGDPEKRTEKPFFFEELKTFSYAGFKDQWPVHYSRAVENQLDVVHLPFVHRTTIGRGNKTLVNGPVVKIEGDLLTFFVKNVVDDGKRMPQKATEIDQAENLPQLQFHFPNIWQNIISDKIRAFAAFVPVDETNSIIYIRYYQKITNIPIVKSFINYVGKLSSIIILRQDKRVVVTQKPLKSRLKMAEELIPGDAPIIEYRKHRHQLIENNKL